MTIDVPQVEYAALRATIRERGSVRMWLIMLGIGTWAALAVLVAGVGYDRAAALIPFLVLAATFELSFFIHTAVERIGRYLQVFYEENGAGWENTVMAYGRNFPGGLDPLFITLFAVIATVNFLGVLVVGSSNPGWTALSLIFHLVFGWRLVTARRLSQNQRTTDLERFRALKNPSVSN